MKRRCYDRECKQPAKYELRKLRMCAEHYIEALEHSAHLDFGQWDGKGGMVPSGVVIALDVNGHPIVVEGKRG